MIPQPSGMRTSPPEKTRACDEELRGTKLDDTGGVMTLEELCKLDELDSPIDEIAMEELEELCKLDELNVELEKTSRLDESCEAGSCAEVPVSLHPKVIITRPNPRNPLKK